MPSIDLVEESFIAATPEVVAAVVRDAANWRSWWPDLALSVFQDRGEKGVRWNVTGALVGSAEIWLQAHGDGVIVHYYLRTDPTAPGSSTEAAAYDARRAERERRARGAAARRLFWRLKDEIEAGRRPGEPAVGAHQTPGLATAAR
jgi:hypothetical protein